MISFDDFDEQNSPRPDHNDFSRILDRAISRRGFLKTGAAFGVSTFVAGGSSAVMAESAMQSKAIGFAAVAANSDDTITVPEGYSWKTLISCTIEGNDRSEALAQRMGATQDGTFSTADLGTLKIWRHLGPEALK